MQIEKQTGGETHKNFVLKKNPTLLFLLSRENTHMNTFENISITMVKYKFFTTIDWLAKKNVCQQIEMNHQRENFRSISKNNLRFEHFVKQSRHIHFSHIFKLILYNIESIMWKKLWTPILVEATCWKVSGLNGSPEIRYCTRLWKFHSHWPCTVEMKYEFWIFTWIKKRFRNIT